MHNSILDTTIKQLDNKSFDTYVNIVRSFTTGIETRYWWISTLNYAGFFVCLLNNGEVDFIFQYVARNVLTVLSSALLRSFVFLICKLILFVLQNLSWFAKSFNIKRATGWSMWSLHQLKIHNLTKLNNIWCNPQLEKRYLVLVSLNLMSTSKRPHRCWSGSNLYINIIINIIFP